MPQFSQLRVVVAKADHELDFIHGGFVRGDPIAERLLEAGNVFHLAIRRREQIRGKRLNASTENVTVCVHEAG